MERQICLCQIFLTLCQSGFSHIHWKIWAVSFLLSYGPGSGRSTGEGIGYPLRYSGLENSMDCIVHGVTNSWTWLSDFHFGLLLPVSSNPQPLTPKQCPLNIVHFPPFLRSIFQEKSQKLKALNQPYKPADLNYVVQSTC